MHRGSSRRMLTGSIVVAVAAGLFGLAASAQAAAPPHQNVSRATKLAQQALARMKSQDLGWIPCINADSEPGLPAPYYRMKCATLTAPLDWSDPAGAQIQIAVSRLPATTSPAQGALFTNPGGPGAEGLDLPLLFLSDNRKALLQTQDIYGMDVRGTGESANVTCGGAPSLSLDPRDRDAANLDLLLDTAALSARACDVAGGALIDHVTTDQTVQDIDLLRSVVGAAKLNWLGFSAGTWLGAQYATAYPKNVGHMVLDSNLDFTSDWQTALDLQPMGFERRFRSDFAGWVAKYQSVYGLGASADAVLASYERIRAGMRSDLPIDSPAALDDLIASSLYTKDLFPVAGQVLSDLNSVLTAQGSGHYRTAHVDAALDRISAALPLLHRTAAGIEPFSGDASDAAFLAITCNDTPWTGDRAALSASSETLGTASPLIGFATIEQPCVFWNRPPVSTPVPNGAGVPPVLMVQSEHDPATPIEGAWHAAAGFAGARMLTVTGDGDHGLYAGGNACVDKNVEKFITAGTLPLAGATCKGTAMPNPLSSAAFRASRKGSFAARASKAGIPAAGTNPMLALQALSRLG
jgi:pimeloyl-ACP methyl ester carboxylesterase